MSGSHVFIENNNLIREITRNFFDSLELCAKNAKHVGIGIADKEITGEVGLYL